MKTDEEILAIQADLKAKGVKYCVGAYVDIHGVQKGKFVPIDHFLHFAHGSELYTGCQISITSFNCLGKRKWPGCQRTIPSKDNPTR